MPSGADFRAALELTMGVTGGNLVEHLAEQLDKVRTAQEAVGEELRQQKITGDQAVKSFEELEAAANKYRAVLNQLAAEEKAEAEAAAQAAGQATRAKIDALARAERAQEAADDAAKKAAGDVLRAKIEAIARAERAQEQADQAAKQAAGDAMRARIDAIARQERAQEQADQAAKQSAGDAMRARIDALARAERQTNTWRESMAKLDGTTAAGAAAAARLAAEQNEAARRTSAGWSQAVLEISRGFEDFAVAGPLGILNNIPRTIGGIGAAAKLAGPQIAALEAAGSGLATVGYLVWQNWGRIKALFDNGLGPKILPDIKELNEQLEALKEKKLPTLAEQQDIKNLEHEVELLNRINEAIKKQEGPTDDQAKSGKIIDEAVKESTGGDRNKLVQAIIASKQGELSSGMRKVQEDYQALLARVKDLQDQGLGEEAHVLYQENIYDLQQRQEEQKKADAANRRLDASRLLGQAGAGDDKARRELEQLYDANRSKFDAQGVGFKFRQALDQADPAKIKAERETAAHKAENTAIEQGEKEIERQVEERVRDAVQSIKGGVDDALEKTLYDAMKGGADRDTAINGARAGLMGKLQARGVDTYIQSKVADALLAQQADKAANLISEDNKPRLDVKADQARHKAETEADQAKRKAATIAAQAQRKLEAEAKEVAPGFMGYAERAFAANAAARANGAPVVRNRREQQHAEAMGQPFSYSDDVMQNYIRQQIEAGLRASGQDPRIGNVIAGQAREKASDTFAKGFGATGNQFMAMAGTMGEAQGLIGQVQGQIAKQANVLNVLQQGNRRLQNGARRTQQQRPSLLTEGDQW